MTFGWCAVFLAPPLQTLLYGDARLDARRGLLVLLPSLAGGVLLGSLFVLGMLLDRRRSRRHAWLAEGERLLFDGWGTSGRTGWLFLTDRRLRFAPSWRGEPIELETAKISDVSAFVIGPRFVVRDEGGGRRMYGSELFERGRWVQAIRAARDAARDAA